MPKIAFNQGTVASVEQVYQVLVPLFAKGPADSLARLKRAAQEAETDKLRRQV